MKKIEIVANPYVVQYGTIDVPDTIDDNELRNYIENHWNEIEFGESEFDYCGIDFDLYEENLFY